MSFGGVVTPNSDLDALEASLDSSAAIPVSCMSTTELSDRAERLVGLAAKFAALRIDTVRAATAANVGDLSDQRNTANHLASRTNVDPAVVRSDQRLAEWLVDMSVVEAALRNGTITEAHVELMRKADNVRVHQQMVDSQDLFVRWFETVHFRDLEPLLNEWLLGADPDGAEPDEHFPETGVTVRTVFGGLVKVVALLDPIQGAAFKGDLSAETRRLRSEEQETGETRSIRRRNLVGLLNLMGRGAARPDGTFARPRVNIVMSQRVYEETLAWLEDPSANSFPSIDRSDVDKKCQLIDGTPIHPLYGVAASATARFRRLVYSARGKPIEASSTTRRIPDWMRDVALVSSNGKCANPVCDAPFSWLHADHITPYSHDGQTSVEDTRMLCEPDNLWRSDDITRGRWSNDESELGMPIPEERGRDYLEEQELTALAKSRLYGLLAEPPKSRGR